MTASTPILVGADGGSSNPAAIEARRADSDFVSVGISNDQPSDYDALGFTPYVAALAEFLSSEDTKAPLTISVEGQWGSGKSSFLRQLKKRIESAPTQGGKGDDSIVLEFNAWRHATAQELWASLALEFTKAALPRGVWRKLRGWLKLASMRTRRVETTKLALRIFVVLTLGLFLAICVAITLFFPKLNTPADDTSISTWNWAARYIVKYAPIVYGSSTFLLGIGAILRKLMLSPWDLAVDKYITSPAHEDKLGDLVKVQEDLKYVCDAFRGTRRVFLLFDDLDRCEPAKAAELIHAMNLILSDDIPFFVVLAMDRAKVAAGLASRQEAVLPFLPSLPREIPLYVRMEEPPPSAQSSPPIGTSPDETSLVGINYAYEFLEKFVQLQVRVPTVTSSGADQLLQLVSSTQPGAPANPAKMQFVSDIAAADVMSAVQMVGPSLDFNPRRLKQYVNLLRFRYFVAAKTGVGSSIGRIALAKVVAIECHWPLLLNQMLRLSQSRVRDLIEYLRMRDDPGPASEGLWAWWKRDLSLRHILNYGGHLPTHDHEISKALPYLAALYGTAPPVFDEPIKALTD